MSEFTLSLPDTLAASNCTCFHDVARFKDKFFQKPPAKISAYVDKEKRRATAILEEINKHQFFVLGEMKPCYGISTTEAINLRGSYYRHQTTLRRLTSFFKKYGEIVNINFGNGSIISVKVYAQTLKGLLKAKIDTVSNFAQYFSPVCVQTLKDSEKSHLDSLSILENVIQTAADGIDKLELYLDAPI